MVKKSQRYFAPERLSGLGETSMVGGVCVNAIVEKIGLTQPVVSTYLTVLKDVGLIRTKRAGKWTYCFYQPESMAEFSSYLNSNF